MVRMEDVEATLAVARRHEVLETFPSTLTLHVLDGKDHGKIFTVRGPVVTAGRDLERMDELPAHPIILKDPTVSVAHFELRWTSKGILLRDLGSTNGTWVGFARLPPRGDGVFVFPRTEDSLGSTFRAGRVLMELVGQRHAPQAVSTADHLGRLRGGSLEMRRLYALLERLAPAPLDVIVYGETGTGKGAVARTIHELSGRAGRFVTLDCTTLNRELAEALIMGHSKGAFTGAVGDRIGFFEEAQGGTIFIDELGELPKDLQAKLLRVIDDREVTRVGETTPRKIDVRVICATNRNLPKEVAEGRFRSDLYHRVTKATVNMAPLRHRKEDIPQLAAYFLERASRELGRPRSFGPDALATLQELEWPGNVRELMNFVELAAVMSDHEVIGAGDLRHVVHPRGDDDGDEPDRTASAMTTLRIDLPHRVARDYFSKAYCALLMTRYDGNIKMAAKHAGYTLRGFQELLHRLESELTADDDDGRVQ